MTGVEAPALRFRLGRVAALACLLISSAGAAQDSRWSLQLSLENYAERSVLGQSYQPSMRGIALERRLADGARAGWQHEYRILDLPAINGVAADTNGHVHRTGPAWRQVSSERRVRIEPGLAVSSNALRHLKDLDAEDIRLSGAIEQRIAGDAASAGWLALHVDDRFGRSRIYPGVQFQFVPTNAHELRLGFPDSSWRWRWTQRVQSELVVAPDGGKWRVRDAELARRSDVRVRAWRLAWSVRWHPADALAVEARIGRRFESDVRYRLRDGANANVEVPDSNFFGLGVTARF